MSMTLTLAALSAGAPPVLAAPEGAGQVQVKERSAIDARYQWILTHLYADEAAWRASKERVLGAFEEVRGYSGKLGDAAQLKACLDRVFELTRELYRLHGYANRLADIDTRDATQGALKGEIQKALSDFGQVSAFIEPELLALPAERLDALLADPSLAGYRHFLDGVARKRSHTLSKGEEELLAQASLLGHAPENVYDVFTGSDLKFGTMTDSQGREVRISTPMYIRYRSAESREDRRKVFDGFWAVYRAHENTFATLLSSQLNRDIFFAKARRYDSSLKAALDPENIDPAVYTTMIAAVKEHLPLLHRYLRLRKRLLGVDELYYHDMYPSLIPKVQMRYSYEEAVEEVAAALAPLGKEYVAKVRAGMTPGSGWMDVFPSLGKRTGAYSSGSAYDVHPFVLLNFDGSYDHVSTLAHEMGHAMHSHLTNTTQPFHYADYSTFTAEIASTFNEALLMRRVLGRTKDPAGRLYLLGQFMEEFRTVVFRQTLFSEFELEIHRLAETGKAPSAKDFNRIYRKLLEEYYGVAEGVTKILDRDEVEWAYIPHFYYNYYVFTYVTGFVSATALSTRVLEGGDAELQAYVGMLKAGSSDYPLPLLKAAGVDMTTEEPYAVAMKRFEAVLDEVEKLTADR